MYWINIYTKNKQLIGTGTLKNFNILLSNQEMFYLEVVNENCVMFRDYQKILLIESNLNSIIARFLSNIIKNYRTYKENIREDVKQLLNDTPIELQLIRFLK